MNIYFSGIGGVGIGPLAEIAHDAGHHVTGSDQTESLQTAELARRGISVAFSQDGKALAAAHKQRPIDVLVHTAALPHNHPELVFARQHGIPTQKRDWLLAQIITQHKLKLIAIAGTHGKTSTTSMMIWALQQLGITTSYSVGSQISFGPSGFFDPQATYFVYECDEFDRNFLHFHPYASLITTIDYDHPDTYPQEADYFAAFAQFVQQTTHSYLWQDAAKALSSHVAHIPETITEVAEPLDVAIPGLHNRQNAALVAAFLQQEFQLPLADITAAIASFPGAFRRFEQLAPGIYSDYGHHPVEIAATLQMAKELNTDITLVYQPHQNVRQHEIREAYTDAIFADAHELYWLPTYLSRENPQQEVLTPAQLTAKLTHPRVHLAEMNDELWDAIVAARKRGSLVLCMGAGTIDGWARDHAATLE